MRKTRSGYTFDMWILIVLFILLFLLLLLSMPLIVEARARASVRGAVVHARVYVLGLIPITVRLRIHLFSEPYFCLCIGKKRIPLIRKRGQKKVGGISGVRILRLDTKTTVGIADEPAGAVRIAGSAAVLLGMLTTRFAERGSARAGLSRTSLLRVSARATAIVFPPALFAGIVRGRITQRKAANNSRKSHEKRTEYASC